MPISLVTLREFTVFEKTDFTLSPGLNVFLGANGTGKTHVMKLLYCGAAALQQPAPPNQLASALWTKLARVFRPDDNDLGRLVRRTQGAKTATVTFSIGAPDPVRLDILSKQATVRLKLPARRSLPTPLFIPSREALSIFEGFIAAYQARELAFDETYFDLAIKLSASALRGTKSQLVKAVQEPLERHIGGKIVLEHGRFYLRGPGGGKVEAALISEGQRKLGSLIRLVGNGGIRSSGLVLWDEPEANLNPDLVVVMAEILGRLADEGIQVIVATHDYLLSETLALHGRARFFNFTRRNASAPVQILEADDLDAVPENALRREFLRHYDRVRGLG